MHGSLSFIQQFIHSNIHKMFQALCCQLLLISLNALFIHKFIPNQFLDCHDTYHNFVFSVSQLITHVSVTQHTNDIATCHCFCSSLHPASLNTSTERGTKSVHNECLQHWMTYIFPGDKAKAALACKVAGSRGLCLCFHCWIPSP